MEQFASPVVLALVGLWVAYLLPQRLRQRTQLLESRSDDRFSGAMRILAVARPARALTEETRDCAAGQLKHHHLLTGAMPAVAVIEGRAEGALDMDRPTTGANRTVAGRAAVAARTETQSRPAPEGARPRALDAAERARRAAVAERRAAAARRRLALTLALLAASAIAWTAVSAFSIHVAIPSALTAMLTGVLVLGRRAAVAGQRTDARPATAARREPVAREARPRPTASVTGRAVHGSETSTQMISSVAVRAAAEATQDVVHEAPSGADDAQDAAPVATAPAVAETTAAEHVAEVAAPSSDASTSAEPEAGGELSGFFLPRPTYTMKAAAPRREPAPLDDADVTTPANASERASAASAEEAAPTVAAEGLGAGLDAILARRRASGE